MYVFRFLQTAHSKTSADNLPWKNAAVAMVRTENNSFDSQKFVLFCFVLFLCFKSLLAGTYFLFRLEWRRIWFAMTATKWNCSINIFRPGKAQFTIFKGLKLLQVFYCFPQLKSRNYSTPLQIIVRSFVNVTLNYITVSEFNPCVTICKNK